MKLYYTDLDLCAADIAYDIILTGESSGWSGELEDVKRLTDILGKYNIKYVDDMRGTWKKVNHSTI